MILAMLGTFLSISGTSFAWQGGSDGKLAEALAKVVNSPVAIIRTESGMHAPRTFEYKSTADLRARVGTFFGLKSPSGGPWGLAPEAWPPAATLRDRRSLDWPEFTGPNEYRQTERPVVGQVKDGRGTLRHREQKWFQLPDLQKLGWSRPIRSHWFYAEIPFALVAEDAAEEEILRAIAFALGARLVVSEKEYEFRFNADIVKARLVTMARRRASSIGGELAMRLEVDALVLQQMPSGDLARLFSRPDNVIRLEVARLPGVRDKVREFIATMFHRESVHEAPDGSSMHDYLLKRLDWDGSWKAIVSAGGEVQLELPFRDGRSFWRT